MEPTEPTKERLDEDILVFKQMQRLRLKENRTEEEEKELNRLFRKYYIENDDIRIYWKTY